MNSIEDFRPMCCCHCYRCSFVFFSSSLFFSNVFALCRVHFALASTTFDLINVTWWLRFVCHSIHFMTKPTDNDSVLTNTRRIKGSYNTLNSSSVLQQLPFCFTIHILHLPSWYSVSLLRWILGSRSLLFSLQRAREAKPKLLAQQQQQQPASFYNIDLVFNGKVPQSIIDDAWMTMTQTQHSKYIMWCDSIFEFKNRFYWF